MDADKLGSRAAELFKSGKNCSQALFVAFAEAQGLDTELASRISAGLGGGVGRMREVCGAVTGATLALGFVYGEDKNGVYDKVQKLCAAFKAQTGSIVCREMLAAAKGGNVEVGGKAEARSAEYYRKRPCVELVRLAAELLAAELPEDGGK